MTNFEDGKLTAEKTASAKCGYQEQWVPKAQILQLCEGKQRQSSEYRIIICIPSLP